MSSNTKNRFMPQLEGMRGMAIFVVMVAHFGLGKTLSVITDTMSLQGFGVRAFFVLSGFLICGQLLRLEQRTQSGGISPFTAIRTFYTNKSLRLYPVYFLAIGALFVVNLDNFRQNGIWNVLFLGNFDFVRYADVGSSGDLLHAPSAHLWSLALQEQFYLLFPFLLLFVSGRSLIYSMIALVAIAPVWRFYWLFIGDAVYPYENMMMVPACLDTLVMGALLCLYQKNYYGFRELVSRWIKPACYLALSFMAILVFSRVTHTGQRLVMAIYDLPYAMCIAVIIKHGAEDRDYAIGRFLNFSPLRFLGRVSYGTYVFHTFSPHIMRYVGQILGVHDIDQTALWAPSLFGLSILMGWCCWEIIEKPFLAMRGRSRNSIPTVKPAAGTAINAP